MPEKGKAKRKRLKEKMKRYEDAEKGERPDEERYL